MSQAIRSVLSAIWHCRYQFLNHASQALSMFVDLPYFGFVQVGCQFRGRKVALSFGVSGAGLCVENLLVRIIASITPTGVLCTLSLSECRGSHYFE